MRSWNDYRIEDDLQVLRSGRDLRKKATKEDKILGSPVGSGLSQASRRCHQPWYVQLDGNGLCRKGSGFSTHTGRVGHLGEFEPLQGRDSSLFTTFQNTYRNCLAQNSLSINIDWIKLDWNQSLPVILWKYLNSKKKQGICLYSRIVNFLWMIRLANSKSYIFFSQFVYSFNISSTYLCLVQCCALQMK